MYDPSTNQWRNLLKERHKVAKFMNEGVSESDRKQEKKEIRSLSPKNALVVDGDECFRIVYTAVKIGGPSSTRYKDQPVVHQLKLNLSRSKPLSAKIGEQQDQKLIPVIGNGAFQIHNKVYVNMKGCVHDTGIKITPGQKQRVDTGVWKKLQDRGEIFEDLTVASFSYDMKETCCPTCLQGQSCKDRDKLLSNSPGMPTARKTDDGGLDCNLFLNRVLGPFMSGLGVAFSN